MTAHIAQADPHCAQHRTRRRDTTRRPVTDFNYKETVRVSRRQAAERLVDLAYMLTAGGPLVLSVEGEQVRVPVPDQLVFERESRSDGDCVELDLEFSWSSGAELPDITQDP